MQITVYLILITIHNFSDIGWNVDSYWVKHTLTYVSLVLLSEVVVDWLKHCFVVKYNQISTSWYGEGQAIMFRENKHDVESSVNLESIACRVRFVNVPFAVVVFKFLFASNLLNSVEHFAVLLVFFLVLRTVLHAFLVYLGRRRLQSGLSKKSPRALPTKSPRAIPTSQSMPRLSK